MFLIRMEKWDQLEQQEDEVVNFKMRLLGLGGKNNTPMGVHRACQCWSDNERRWSNDWDVEIEDGLIDYRGWDQDSRLEEV